MKLSIELLILLAIVYLGAVYLGTMSVVASCIGACVGLLHWIFKGNKNEQ